MAEPITPAARLALQDRAQRGIPDTPLDARNDPAAHPALLNALLAKLTGR
jgi:hypothetical protein